MEMWLLIGLIARLLINVLSSDEFRVLNAWLYLQLPRESLAGNFHSMRKFRFLLISAGLHVTTPLIVPIMT